MSKMIDGTIPINISINISPSWVFVTVILYFATRQYGKHNPDFGPGRSGSGPWCSEISTRLQGRTWKNLWQELPRGSSTLKLREVGRYPTMPMETTNDWEILGDKTNQYQPILHTGCVFACKNWNASAHSKEMIGALATSNGMRGSPRRGDNYIDTGPLVWYLYALFQGLVSRW